MPGIRLIRMGVTEAWKTQAMYHAVAETMTDGSPDTIILCRPDAPYLCLGYHQALDDLFDARACALQSLPVYRRKVGGGATYLDGDQVFYQCIFHPTSLPAGTREIFSTLLEAPIRALRRLGLGADLFDINEIRVGGRRIAGTGGGAIGDAVVVIGNIIGDFPFDILPSVWRLRGGSGFRGIAAAALRAHVTSLRLEGVRVAPETLDEVIADEYLQTLGRPLAEGGITPAEEQRALRVAEELRSEEFVGSPSHLQASVSKPLKIASGVYLHAATAAFRGSPVRAVMCVREGMIVDASIDSDVQVGGEDAVRALVGNSFERWRERLQCAQEAA